MTTTQSLLLRFSFPPCPKTKHPHLLRNPFSSPHLKPLRRPTTTKISASSSPTPASDRLLSSIAYFFPFFNGLQYGRFLISQYPAVLGPTLQPFLPFLSLYRSIPYASYAAFLALYMGVARNPNLSRFARFNAMQAVVLDVLLVLPMLVERIFNPGRSGFAFKLLVLGNNALFLLVVCCFLYTVVSSVMGKTPYLPFIADAAARQI